MWDDKAGMAMREMIKNHSVILNEVKNLKILR